jgi:hypothetical protein
MFEPGAQGRVQHEKSMEARSHLQPGALLLLL